jgi:hypothetical protein
MALLRFVRDDGPFDSGAGLSDHRNFALGRRVGTHHHRHPPELTMQSDVIEFAQVMTVIVASVAAFILIGFGARFLWQLGNRQSRPLPSADPEHLRQLESAVDAIAIEVERISEAQRFTVALLSDRLPARTEDRMGAPILRAQAARHDTPH